MQPKCTYIIILCASLLIKMCWQEFCLKHKLNIKKDIIFLWIIFGVLLIYILGASYRICVLGLCTSYTITLFSSENRRLAIIKARSGAVGLQTVAIFMQIWQHSFIFFSCGIKYNLHAVNEWVLVFAKFLDCHHSLPIVCCLSTKWHEWCVWANRGWWE